MNSIQPFEFLSGSSSPNKTTSSRGNLPETTSPTSYSAFPEDAEGAGERQMSSDTSTAQHKKNKEIVQGIYIGLFAILGTFLRVIVAQIFGEYCKNPDSIGWLKASAPLCVTQGGATEQGGIIFADLPANMLGSFIMGFFQNGSALRLALPLALVWLKPYDSLQNMPILHKGITTGFCGSLTTFSGWNSAMVVLLFGTGQNRPTHVFNAVFGYIIGVETAIGSFVAGKSVARRLHQIVNPVLAAEARAMKERSEEGVYINPRLPDFERRFLPDLQMGEQGERHYGEMLPMVRLDALENWRASTKDARRVRHPQLDLLNRIETAVLIDGLAVPPDAVSYAKANGWDIEALQAWAASNRNRADRLPSISSVSSMNVNPGEEYRWFQPAFAATILGVVVVILLVLLFMLNGDHAYTITNRTMIYAMLCAPPGAVLRWKLSSLNGTVTTKSWEWFPMGTFLANLMGCIISMIAVGYEYDMEAVQSIYDVTFFWGIGTVRAIKVGFVGSLTTVSTFVAEINGFMRTSDHAYPYMLTTLFSCCSAASFFYGGLLLMRNESEE